MGTSQTIVTDAHRPRTNPQGHFQRVPVQRIPKKTRQLEFKEPTAAKPDPLYQAVCARMDEARGASGLSELSRAQIAVAAYQSGRLKRILNFLEKKFRLDADDARQELILSLLHSVTKNQTVFPTEDLLFSYLVRIGANIRVKQCQDINSTMLSYSGEEATGTGQVANHAIFSDGGAQISEHENRLDKAHLHGKIQAFRTANKSVNSMLQSSYGTHAIARPIHAAKEISGMTDRPKPLPTSSQKAEFHSRLSPQLWNTPIKTAIEVPTIVRPAPKSAVKPQESDDDPKVPVRKGRPVGSIGNAATEPRRSPEHAELFALWKQSKLLQDNYATAIGIMPATLKSYIYARTQSVPAETLEKARRHAKASQPKVDQLERKFSGTMTEIIERWSTEIAKEKLTSNKLATILHVDETTVLRWRTKSKPNVRALSKYELKLKSHFRR